MGNADPYHYETIPDYKVELSERGKIHANEAGHQIKHMIGDEQVTAYVSPWTRTRETFDEIALVLKDQVLSNVEDPRLREQEWGHLRKIDDNQKIKKERIEYGTFYYRIPDGESGADVYDRVSTFLETLHRDFKKKDYPENVLIVTHGVTLRIFLMRWFHWTPEYYEEIKNPQNGQVVFIERQKDGFYKLITQLTQRTR